MRDLFDGASCLVRGIGIFVSTPGLWLMGLVPALLAVVLLGVLLGALVVSLPTVAAAVTPFAAGWSQTDRDALRLLIEVVLAVGGVWLALISYTAIAIAIGQPFYERIARRVDEREGGVPVVAEPAAWRAMLRALRDGVLIILLSAAIGIALFLLGLLPLIGQTVVPVVGACVTGFFLAVELSSVALERRGLGLADRLGLLWRRPMLSLGFGVLAFLVFLIPLIAVVAMPGAIAGGTLLARRLTPTR